MEERFKEFNDIEESWTACQKRIIAAIEDIVEKHDNDDVILCVTKNGCLKKKLSPNDASQATFCIGKDKPVAFFDYCNLHGLWMTEL